ncbi:MAG: UbiA family prenyltransferase, partial [Flavobacteriales bacterium]|nr:UbiA family prenyltransferase [Flavobacteriales bacterium]
MASHLRDIAMLFKLRLASLVVFSAVLGYLMGTESPKALELVALSLGGFLLTGASNGFNQIWERDIDAKMERTKDRP